MRTYSDDQLREAVAGARSWRGVLRALGLASTSSGAIRSVRRQVDLLELDHSHFRGARRWRDDQLADAVASSTSWGAVGEALGLRGGSAVTAVRGHAARLRLETAHLSAGTPPQTRTAAELVPDPSRLSRAGSLLAAAWFEMCGTAVSWPLEHTRYDLLAWRDGRAERIQVKTTTLRAGGTWKVQLTTGRSSDRTYDPDEIDQFFVITEDLSCYLIPVEVVGGLKAVHLSAYAAYRLAPLTAAPARPC